MKTKLSFFILILIFAACTGTSSQNANSAESAALFANNGTIKLGAIVRDGETKGQASLAIKLAMELARDDINAEFSKAGTNVKVELDVKSVGDDPNLSLKEFKALADSGVRVVVGFETSGSLLPVTDYAQAKGILVISTSATANTLATENDTIYRLVPNDTLQAKVISKLMKEQGIVQFGGLYRQDVYGVGLYNLVKESAGTEKIKSDLAFSYLPTVTKFSAQIGEFDNQLQNLVKASEKAKVATLAIGFDEIGPILTEVSSLTQNTEKSVIGRIKMFGADGNAEESAITSSKERAAAARAVNFEAPSFIYPAAKKADYDALVKRIREKGGDDLPVSAYVATAYDSVILAAKTSAQVADKNKSSDWRKALCELSSSMNGMSGPLALDAKGDRKNGDYAIWKIAPDSDSWVTNRTISSTDLGTNDSGNCQ